MKRLISVLFVIAFIMNDGYSQLRFPITPTVIVKNDSTFYKLSHPTFYSYFKLHLDSIFISFDSIVFNQEGVIDNKSQHGYLEISYNDQVLVKNEIRNGKISGIGLLYHPNLLGLSYELPYCQAHFSNNKLHGVVIFYDEIGITTEILLFRKGKYLKHLYHKKAITDESLKKGNKLSGNPFGY